MEDVKKEDIQQSVQPSMFYEKIEEDVDEDKKSNEDDEDEIQIKE